VLEKSWKNSFITVGFSLSVFLTLLSFTSCSVFRFGQQTEEVVEGSGKLEDFLQEGLAISGRGSVISEIDGKKVNFGFVATLRKAGVVRILVSDIIGRKVTKIDIDGDSYAIWIREGNRRCRGVGVIECSELPFIYVRAGYVDDILLAREMEESVFIKKRSLGEGLSILKSGVVSSDSVCSYTIDYDNFRSVDRVIFPGMVKIACSDFGYTIILEYRKIRVNRGTTAFRDRSVNE